MFVQLWFPKQDVIAHINVQDVKPGLQAARPSLEDELDTANGRLSRIPKSCDLYFYGGSYVYQGAADVYIVDFDF